MRWGGAAEHCKGEVIVPSRLLESERQSSLGAMDDRVGIRHWKVFDVLVATQRSDGAQSGRELLLKLLRFMHGRQSPLYIPPR